MLLGGPDTAMAKLTSFERLSFTNILGCQDWAFGGPRRNPIRFGRS